MDMTNRRQQKTRKDDGTRSTMLNREGRPVPACVNRNNAWHTVTDAAVMSMRQQPASVPEHQCGPAKIARARTPRL